MPNEPRAIPERAALRVSVADPDPVARTAVSNLLQSLGAVVDCHETAETLLAGLGTALPSCIVICTSLPDMPGLDLLHELRRRGSKVPAIVLAADGDVAQAVLAMRAGALDFVEKPKYAGAIVKHVTPLLERDVDPGL
jgi:FixJ family two-component response regulator